MFGRTKTVTALKGNAGKTRRNEALSAPASAYAAEGIDTSQVWLAAIEIVKPESHITYVSLSDGSTAVYYSTGKGYEGLASATSVAEASREFVERASLMKDQFEPNYSVAYPDRDKVTLYYRLGDALFSVTAMEDVLAVGGNPLTPLYKRARDVMQQANAVLSR